MSRNEHVARVVGDAVVSIFTALGLAFRLRVAPLLIVGLTGLDIVICAIALGRDVDARISPSDVIAHHISAQARLVRLVCSTVLFFDAPRGILGAVDALAFFGSVFLLFRERLWSVGDSSGLPLRPVVTGMTGALVTLAMGIANRTIWQKVLWWSLATVHVGSALAWLVSLTTANEFDSRFPVAVGAIAILGSGLFAWSGETERIAFIITTAAVVGELCAWGATRVRGKKSIESKPFSAGSEVDALRAYRARTLRHRASASNRAVDI